MPYVNYIAVAVSAIAAMVVGYIFYSPYLFGNMWQKLSKMKPGAMTKSYMPMVVAYIGAVVTAYVLSAILSYSQSRGVIEAATTAFIVWLGFIATTVVIDDQFTDKPMQLTLLNAAHHLVSIVTIAVVLAYMA
jgi:hypothetical protein